MIVYYNNISVPVGPHATTNYTNNNIDNTHTHNHNHNTLNIMMITPTEVLTGRPHATTNYTRNT